MSQRRSIAEYIFGRSTDDGTSYFSGVVTAGQSSAGEIITAEEALAHPTVLTCLKSISDPIAQLKCGVVSYDGDGNEMYQPNHQISQLLYRPNDFQTKFDFVSAIVFDLLAYGNSFTLIIRSSRGAQSLVPLDPSDVKISANSAGRPVYETSLYGTKSADEIIHIKDVAGHGAISDSRVELAKPLVGALAAANKQMGATFANGVSVNYVVRSDDSYEAEAKKDFLQSLSAAFGAGGNRRGGLAFLDSGMQMDAIKGNTAADTDLRALREHLINEIGAVFGVPSAKLGTGGNQTFNNSSAQEMAFYRNTLAPIITNIEEALSRALLPRTMYLKFDVDRLLKGDSGSQATYLSQVGGLGVLTVNEMREYLGFSAIEGGDELPQPNPQPAEPDRAGEETDDGNVGEQQNR